MAVEIGNFYGIIGKDGRQCMFKSPTLCESTSQPRLGLDHLLTFFYSFLYGIPPSSRQR